MMAGVVANEEKAASTLSRSAGVARRRTLAMPLYLQATSRVGDSVRTYKFEPKVNPVESISPRRRERKDFSLLGR
jgi:hypothetical protein